MKYIKKFQLFEDVNHLQKSNIDLSIELQNKLRTLSDDSKMTVDDFVSEFGVEPKHMTDFAWASILKNSQKYNNMSDEEFSKLYKEYKSNISDDENDESQSNISDDENDEDKNDFDLDFAMAKIKEQFDEDKVIGMFDEEVLEWVDSDWQDDYESEYDWYVDHNNGEAQDSVISQIIRWFENTYNQSLLSDDIVALTDAIKEEYDTLNY